MTTTESSDFLNPLNGKMKSGTFVSFCILLAFLLSSCEPSLPPPKTGVANWKIQSVAGPLEVRPIPPANQILNEYKEWIESESTDKARLYETALTGASNQLAFKVEIRKDNTPVGHPNHTFVSFVYRDPLNGTYQYLWHRLGRHTGEYLKLTESPRIVWVQFNEELTKGSGVPMLEIVAFEGLEPSGVVVAMPGRKRKEN